MARSAKSDVPSTDALMRRMGEVEKATLSSEVPRPHEFLYELKYDGYRFLGVKSGDDVRLVSRKGHDWSTRFPRVVDALRKIRARDVVLDGEVCALDARGVPSFNLLQNANLDSSVVYVAFDLLWHEGEDLRGAAPRSSASFAPTSAKTRRTRRACSRSRRP
jgi:bifunctional non-homologous end joining protein LigD